MGMSDNVSDSDKFYCSCWSATFDVLQLASTWVIFMWMALLAGVLSVLYIAAEPKLSKLPTVEQAEVLGFVVVALAILACKVTVFADGLPWSEDAGGGVLSWIFGDDVAAE